MSKKHFIRLAQEFKLILAVLPTGLARDSVIVTIESVMRVCADCNSQFDRDRFRTACGL
jgi:hypothetical protein